MFFPAGLFICGAWAFQLKRVVGRRLVSARFVQGDLKGGCLGAFLGRSSVYMMGSGDYQAVVGQYALPGHPSAEQGKPTDARRSKGPIPAPVKGEFLRDSRSPRGPSLIPSPACYDVLASGSPMGKDVEDHPFSLPVRRDDEDPPSSHPVEQRKGEGALRCGRALG